MSKKAVVIQGPGRRPRANDMGVEGEIRLAECLQNAHVALGMIDEGAEWDGCRAAVRAVMTEEAPVGIRGAFDDALDE